MNYEDFQGKVAEVLKKQGKILILVKYSYQAGNKDFFIINSKQGLKSFFDQRTALDSITVFKKRVEVITGVLSSGFNSDILRTLDRPKYTDWLIVTSDMKNGSSTWDYAEDKLALQEVLASQIGHDVHIMEDPAYLDQTLTLHYYRPDDDGHVKVGVY